jgi:peptidoglycan hydrolase CwlO-like protein
MDGDKKDLIKERKKLEQEREDVRNLQKKVEENLKRIESKSPPKYDIKSKYPGK